MTRQRGRGEGSIYFHKASGRWCAAITVQLPDRRRRRWFYGQTRREVQEKLASAVVRRQQGTLALERPTLAQHLERWLAVKRRPRTHASYESYVRRHLLPAFGSRRLDELTVTDVTHLLEAKMRAGLSAQTVGHLRAVLRSALSDAMRQELVFRNVAAIARPPAGVEPYEGRVLAPDEVRRFIDAARADRLSALYLVLLPLGLRIGEALALRWEDIDLEARTVHVRHTLQPVPVALRETPSAALVLAPTKTRRSKQKLPLPEVCVRALREHHKQQLEERFAAGVKWIEQGLVFTSRTGHPLHSKNVLFESFRPICVRAGIPYSTRERQRGPADERGLRLYDLRHSCASLLIAEGVPLRVVQDVLRHANIRTTADRYTHLVPQTVAEAVSVMDRRLLEVSGAAS